MPNSLGVTNRDCLYHGDPPCMQASTAEGGPGALGERLKEKSTSRSRHAADMRGTVRRLFLFCLNCVCFRFLFLGAPLKSQVCGLSREPHGLLPQWGIEGAHFDGGRHPACYCCFCCWLLATWAGFLHWASFVIFRILCLKTQRHEWNDTFDFSPLFIRKDSRGWRVITSNSCRTCTIISLHTI